MLWKCLSYFKKISIYYKILYMEIQLFLDNSLKSPLLYGLIAIFLGVYGPRLHPGLPISVRNLFNNSIFRFMVIVLIIYMANRDLYMALLLAIGFLVVISMTNMIDVRENLMISASIEKFENSEEETEVDSTVQQFYGQEQFDSEANAKAKSDMANNNANQLKEIQSTIDGMESKLLETCSKAAFDKLVDNKEANTVLKQFCDKHSVGTKEDFTNIEQTVNNYKF